MPTDRVQRQIDRLLDEAEQAIAASNWAVVIEHARNALALDPANQDALAFLAAADRRLGSTDAVGRPDTAQPKPSPPPLPTSFVAGRYAVLSELGEGGRKVVYRARDSVLKREVAFALIKTDGLDNAGRVRVRREAELLEQLGTHPNVVTIHDLGEDDGRPYLVSEFLPGGDLAQLIQAAPDHRLPLPRVLELAVAVAKGLVYAHGHGVVHRDLKPGNIWLTDDGTPKLGDFGLAVARDDPRLTQAGMIAGTALYMAPEQATGGEVTARSDLYSLGCLLYELVTGRPPFVGDESVVIIGQHLHANPVSPMWYRPDCPAALEALILRLLEKDPAKRPASASDIAEALADISPTARRSTSESRRQVKQSGPSPVYQRAFVGREPELRQLEAAFDAAVAGQGGLVMVVGEPGIGKTSLTEQVVTYAGLRGGRVLVGHCYEEGSLSLPYLPFVEALRSYVLDREPAALMSELGSAGPEVARIVSEVRDRVQIEPSAASGDGAEDRYRLLNAVAGFLRNAGQVQPLVLVLEDLHDADRGTLDLLQFLARQLSSARLLVIGTYRDVEVDRAHPLSATLAELQRGASFVRFRLRGLTADEVQRMLAAITGQEVRWALAEAVHRQTEGNPLFVQEVIRYLAEEGHIKRDGGRWQAAGDTPLLQTIPEGLRDVIGKRLSRLSADCNRLLSIAAVIGRDFQLATLATVTAEPAERVSELLDEAVKVAVLQEQASVGTLQYRFAHAFFRQTLYDELSAARRLRLHQQVARALEQQYAARLEEHAAELAEHYTHSTDAADLAKAVSYGQVAAQRASRVYAHGEAARLLEQALDVQEVLDPADRVVRCDLLLELAEVLIAGGEAKRAAEVVAEAAYALAEDMADSGRATRAATQALLGMMVDSSGRALLTPEYRRWVTRLDAHAADGSVERAVAETGLAQLAWAGGHPSESRRHFEQAVTLARRLGDRRALFRAGGTLLIACLSQQDEAWRLQIAEELLAASRDGAAPSDVANALIGGSFILLQWGRRSQAEAACEELAAFAKRVREAYPQLLALSAGAMLATLDGNFNRVLELRLETLALGEATGLTVSGGIVANAFSQYARLRVAKELDSAPDGIPASWRIINLAMLGRHAEARRELDAALTLFRIDDEEFHQHVWFTQYLLEAAVLIGAAEAAAKLAQRVHRLDALCAGAYVGPCYARLLGGAAALNGERQTAIAYFRQAIENTTRIRFRPELALSRLELAEVLADGNQDEHAEAAAHLTFAIAEFEAMCMQPALERARLLQARLSPPSPPPAAEQSAPTAAAAATALRAGQVFISYSSDDHTIAFALEAKLKDENIPVWLDKHDIPAGSSWDAEIVRGIRSSAVVAVLVTPKAMASDHVRQELRLAMQYKKPVLPLLLQPTPYPEEVEYVLAGRQWVEVLDHPEAAWFPQVLAAVRRLA